MPDNSSTGLVAADFGAYMRACHGHDPFPWQAALVAEVLATRQWPDLVDVPTGLGKTSMIDVAVFVAAATVGQTGGDRLGRRRCFFVVDRRIVVDEASQHAARISSMLARAEHAADSIVLRRVAAGLRAYAPQARGELLPVTRMRGGISWASAWLDRPDRPGIVLGTVDQVGSRLLFRGYGVSDRRRPIDAALTGTDALLLIDEAHLSTALLSTLDAAHRRDRLGVPVPGCSVVRLSATGTPGRHTFALDVTAHLGDAEAWPRLTASKTLTVQEATAKSCPRVLADEAQRQLTRLSEQRSAGASAPTVLVVCNTVDRARAVHALLHRQFTARTVPLDADCHLLIGRSRPVDRAQLQEAIVERYGVARPAARRAAILVATQTVEVGVNLDVDALITESASWEALVQRLGRLNRLGRFHDRYPDAGPAVAVVVHDGQADAPVYGAARDATWQTLHTVVAAAAGSGIDVSPLACRDLSAETFAGDRYRQTPTEFPVLLRPTLDAWVQTSPVPLLDPPIEPYLHGFAAGTAPVQVLWRDGLISTDPVDDPFADDGAELAADSIDAMLTQCPPRTAETVEVPFYAVRQWLAGQPVDPISDLDAALTPDMQRSSVREPFRALARRPDLRDHTGEAGPDTPTRWVWLDAGQVRPGDQIVVPAERGGLDQYGWAPTDRNPVREAAELVTFLPGRSRRGGTLRLDAQLSRRLALPDEPAARVATLIAETIGDQEASTGDRLQRIGQDLADALPDEPSAESGWTGVAWARLRAWAASGRLRTVELLDPTTFLAAGGEPSRWALLLTGPVPDPSAVSTGLAVRPERDDEETAASSVSTGPVRLTDHHTAVRHRCGEIAAALGLPDMLRAVLEDAAGWHDLGKTEARFQIMLHHGDACEAAVAIEPLAKSGLDPADRLAWRRATRLSGLPAGARHEAWSAALVQSYLAQTGVYPGDQDLLVHLVAAHHGYARPLARLVYDPAPRPVTALVNGQEVTVDSDATVDLGQPGRFVRLNDRYGRWGLALLEAIVRCADVTVSEEGS
jgi:CRISPR-associated endonuclease/helicase Cas3